MGGAILAIRFLGAAVWGVWIAPRTKRPLADPWRFTIETALFVLGGVALWIGWTPVVGVVFAAASIVVAALTRAVGEPAPVVR